MKLLSFPVCSVRSFYLYFFPVSLVVLILDGIGAGLCWVSLVYIIYSISVSHNLVWLPFSVDCFEKLLSVPSSNLSNIFYLSSHRYPMSGKGSFLSTVVLPCLPQ
jgi:hypothetical protein